MEQTMRHRLRQVVTQCRQLLEDAVREALAGQFGVDPDGKIADDAAMGHLAPEDRLARRRVVQHLEHVVARGEGTTEAIARLARSIAFTHLNRLCAYKMAERRTIIRETVSRGMESNGFKFYLAGDDDQQATFDRGEPYLAYRHFLQWTAQRLARDVPALFTALDPANHLFPAAQCLENVLALLNGDAIAEVWDYDETLGWVYQYFTPKEQRAASARDHR